MTELELGLRLTALGFRAITGYVWVRSYGPRRSHMVRAIEGDRAVVSLVGVLGRGDVAEPYTASRDTVVAEFEQMARAVAR